MEKKDTISVELGCTIHSVFFKHEPSIILYVPAKKVLAGISKHTKFSSFLKE